MKNSWSLLRILKVSSAQDVVVINMLAARLPALRSLSTHNLAATFPKNVCEADKLFRGAERSVGIFLFF